MADYEEGKNPEEASVEAPAEETSEVTEESSSEGIPQWRFNEVNEARKAAEDRAKMYEEALLNAGKTPQQPAQIQPAQAPERGENLSEDQKWLRETMDPVLEQYIGPIRNEMQSVLDKQSGTDFWAKWGDKVPQDVMSSVEEGIEEARNLGVRNVNREHLLDYHLGKYHRNDLVNKTASATQAQQQVEEANKVAVVESGSTTTEPPDKSIENMSASELLDKYGNMPFGD